jgi:hypothetical protein
MKNSMSFLLALLALSCGPSYESTMQRMGMIDYPSLDAQQERTNVKWEDNVGMNIHALFFMDFSWDTVADQQYLDLIKQGQITPTMYADLRGNRRYKNLGIQMTIKSKSYNEASLSFWEFLLGTSDSSYYVPMDSLTIKASPQVTSSVGTGDILHNLINKGPGFAGGGTIFFPISREDLIKRKVSSITLYYGWSTVGQQRINDLVWLRNKNNYKGSLSQFTSTLKSITWDISKMEIEKTTRMATPQK